MQKKLCKRRKEYMITQQIECFVCKQKFEKEIRKIKQTEKLNKQHTCSRKCAARISNDKRKKLIHSSDASENTRRDRQKRPEEYKARQLVRQALKSGKLIRPEYCEQCGTPCRAEAHHEDHSRPYMLLWVCEECHKFHDKYKLKGYGKDYSEQII